MTLILCSILAAATVLGTLHEVKRHVRRVRR